MSIHSALHGYLSATFENTDRHGFGVSYYATVWALVSRPLKDFQAGLPSTWIQPNNYDFKLPLCPVGTVARDSMSDQADSFFISVFQNIEGGAGFGVLRNFQLRRQSIESTAFRIATAPK